MVCVGLRGLFEAMAIPINWDSINSRSPYPARIRPTTAAAFGRLRNAGMNMAKPIDEFNEKEAQARFEAALKGALKTSPKPLKDKPKVKKAKKKRAAKKG
jgi:hypothetical protein